MLKHIHRIVKIKYNDVVETRLIASLLQNTYQILNEKKMDVNKNK